MRRFFRNAAAVFCILTMLFANIPAAQGNLTAEAAAGKKQAKKITAVASTNDSESITIRWNRIKGAKGYAVFRNGRAIAHLGKKATRYIDDGLSSGTTYTYQIKSYTKKVKKKNGKKTVKYSYKKKSRKVSATTERTRAERQNAEWERILSEGEYKELSVMDYHGYVTTIYSYTKDGATQYFRHSNDARGYYLGISGYNPMTNSEVARVWRDYDGEFSGYKQKDGVTFGPLLSGKSSFSVEVFNGDLSKLWIKCENPVVEYTTYGLDLKNPETFHRAAIIGKHGRRAASYELDDLEGYETVFDKFTLQRIGLTLSSEFDDADVIFKVYYGDEEIGTATMKFTYNENNLHYNVAKTAVQYFKDGNSVESFSAEDYNHLRELTGDYNADMRAIEWYVRDKYTYDEFRCTGGAAILEAYSVMEYGMYGHCCCSIPSNPWHVAFRPDEHMSQGDWNWYYETNGQR